jgi:putative transcriptional regulator
MKITHHLDPATLVGYASGTLSEALSVVAASHLAWCPACRQAARQAEMIGSELLKGIEPADVSAECRATTLSRLDQATLHRFPVAAPIRGDLPDPLARLIGGKSLDELNWKRRGLGASMVELPLAYPDRGKLVLMRISAGKAMPEHGHGGTELTLVLSGAYHDRFGRFAAGDVADHDADVEHQPIAESSDACICLVATEAPTRFKSLAARLLQPFIGI